MTTQKTTQNTGSNNNPPFNPHDYQPSSGAISFAALMEVLKMYQDMRSSTAEASVAVINAKLAAVKAQADSTFNSYKADADMLGFQACEAWGQVASSAVQLGSGMASGYMCSNASKNVDKMDNFASTVKQQLNAGEIEMREMGARTQADTKLLNTHREKILSGSFAPEEYSLGLESKLGNSNLKLRDVFETGEVNDRLDLQKAITKAQANTHNRYQSAQSEAQRKTAMFNTIGQGAASANSAAFKQTGETQAMLDKARAALEQAYAVASKDFADETCKSMQALIDQGVQGANTVFQYMAQMVAQDTRA